MTGQSKRLVGALAVSATMLSGGCGDPSRGLQPGASEGDVIRRLGQPSRIIERQEFMSVYIDERSGCRDVGKVFYYHHYVTDDVVVGLGRNGMVKCVMQTKIITKY